MAKPALPSLQTAPGSLRPIGFIDEPDALHRTASSDAIESLVRASENPTSPNGRPLRINFCHYRHNHLLSPQLFGFVVHYFDTNGARVDALENDLPIRYAINLNLPVELQQETALALIAELIFRQKRVDPTGSDFDISALDAVVQEENERALSAISDALRFGWRSALETLMSMAHSEGWDMVLAYQEDPLPTRADVVNRHPTLKRAYNSIDEVRLLVDRFVSLFGGHGRFRIGGGSDESRAYLQGWSGIMHVSEYLSHLTRDSQVLGNGFATFHAVPSPTISVHDPSTVEVVDQETFYLLGEGSERQPIVEHTLHFRGIDQPESEYGMSMLEPLVGSYEALRSVEVAWDAASQFANRPNATEEMVEWADKCERLYQTWFANFQSTIRNMYYLPLQHWDFEPGSLYFSGHDRYPE